MRLWPWARPASIGRVLAATRERVPVRSTVTSRHLHLAQCVTRDSHKTYCNTPLSAAYAAYELLTSTRTFSSTTPYFLSHIGSHVFQMSKKLSLLSTLYVVRAAQASPDSVGFG